MGTPEAVGKIAHISIETQGTTSKFYHADALGSTRGITNSSQAVTDSLRYDAFGNVMNRTGTTPTPLGLSL